MEGLYGNQAGANNSSKQQTSTGKPKHLHQNHLAYITDVSLSHFAIVLLLLLFLSVGDDDIIVEEFTQSWHHIKRQFKDVITVRKIYATFKCSSFFFRTFSKWLLAKTLVKIKHFHPSKNWQSVWSWVRLHVRSKNKETSYCCYYLISVGGLSLTGEPLISHLKRVPEYVNYRKRHGFDCLLKQP